MNQKDTKRRYKRLKIGKLRIPVPLILLFLFFLVVFLMVNNNHDRSKTDKKDTLTYPAVSQTEFSTQLSQAMKSATGNFDLDIYDVSKDKTYTFSKGSEKTYYLASTVKVSVLAELLLTDNSDGSDFSDDLTSDVQNMIRWSDDDSTTDIIENYIGGYGAT